MEKKEESSLSNFRYIEANRKGSSELPSRLWWPRAGIKPSEVYPKQTYSRIYACNLTFLNSHIHVNVCVKILESIFLFLIGNLIHDLIKTVVLPALCPRVHKAQLCRPLSFLALAHFKFSSQMLSLH